jgi:subtilisin family serine protease
VKIPHRLSWSVGACVALAFAAPAIAQEAQLELVNGTTSVQKPKASVSTYIVRLREKPAVAYDGDVAGLKATRPGKGKKIDPEAPAVIDYVSYLQSRHDAVIAQHGGGQKLHSYAYTFNGFAAKMTGNQAKELASDPAVVSVWKDEERHLYTNRTPTFLGLTAPGGLWEQLGGIGKAGEDVIIGMVDSGFWPENPAFSDRDADGKLVYQNPVHWPGKCHPGEAFNASNCNQKVIGARYYNAGFGGDAAVKARYPNDFNSPRDGGSHGSHTGSTAGGNANVHALVNGVDYGVISGMAPRARLSIYKSCYGDGATSACFTSDSVAAIDQAVADGVDVLNYSISGSLTSNVDAVQVAFLFAVDAGVFVAAAAGNEGPGASTVNHNAPWMMTVAAGTHDRGTYTNSVTLGNGASYTGVSATKGSGVKPTVLALDAGVAAIAGVSAADLAAQVAQCWSNNTGGGLNPASGANVNRLDPAKVAGKIVVCERGGNARVDKSDAVKAAGGAGMILVNVEGGSATLDSDPHAVPTVHLPKANHDAVFAYVGGTSNASSNILPSFMGPLNVAPDVASFSSRGPAGSSGGDILKPDIMAPGVSVLAAVSPATPTEGGKNFDFFQGTSMATPHIAGIAALFKQRHPDWSPSMIKSALMTSASQVRNDGTAIGGNAFDKGAGQVTPNAAVDPGLVYDAGFNDWLMFLCGTGELLGCTTSTTIDPSNLNYPSIAIGALPGTQIVKRTVKNVGSSTSTYSASVTAPPGIVASVVPATFSIAPGATKSYEVTFTRTTAALNVYAQGAITLSDGTHTVRSPFAVKPVLFQGPAQITSNGAATSYQVTFGYTGAFLPLPRGLVAPVVTAGSVADDPTDEFVAPGQPGTASFNFTTPPGTTVIRFALFDTDVDGAHDLDLYVFSGTSFLGGSGGPTANEVVTLTSSNGISGLPLTVVVHGFQTATPIANFKLFAWFAQGDAGNMTVTAPPSAVIGTNGTVNVSFSGLAPKTRYVGSIQHRLAPAPAGTNAGTTIVNVTTP